jgi:hypothetical protein
MDVNKFHEDIQEFLFRHFNRDYDHDPEAISDDEVAEIERMVDTVSDSLLDNVGELGMALDFLIVAEELSQVDGWQPGYTPNIDKGDILSRYDTKDTSTLTILYGGEQYGIRPVQNEVRDLFIYELRRTNFPSSPGYHTGNWPDYDDLLEHAFRLSSLGRFEAALRLFEVGMEKLDEKRYEDREPPFSTPFSDIVRDYRRSDPDENGGLAFQAMAYGYTKAEWSHLSFRASKVRTGSSRQNRYGDIDGFLGPDLMISVEVKDLDITGDNVRSQLGQMLDLIESSTAVPIAICRRISDDARDVLTEEGVKVLDNEDLLSELEQWDYHKENRAVQGMLHYLANIEENPDAVQRLLRFLKRVDEDNRALVHLID